MTMMGEAGLPRARAMDWIADHNPLYLVSAALMMLGCFLLSSAIDMRAGEVGKLAVLLGTMNVYEFLLIGLGIFLWRRGVVRDGMLLLLIEGLFLANLTFLNAEAASAGIGTGILINGSVFLLAIAKLGIVIWKLPLEKSWRTLGFAPAMMAMLCALPVVLRAISRGGEISERAFYGSWWAAGLLPVAFDIVSRWRKSPADVGERAAVRGAWTGFLWIGLAAQLGFGHWVYGTEFFAADLSPVLLGVMVIMPRLPMVGANVFRARLALGGAVMLTAFSNPEVLGIGVFGTAQKITPAMLTLCGLAMAAAYLRGWMVMLGAAGVLSGIAVIRLWGPPFATVMDAIAAGVRWIAWGVRQIIPTTAWQWGIVAMAGGFVALGLGMMVSLKKGREERN